MDFRSLNVPQEAIRVMAASQLLLPGTFGVSDNQNELYRGTKNIHTAIWASAIIFSAIHIQFYGFIPRMLLGALFGYLYYWSGNLLVPMFAHFFNNAFGVTMIYLHRLKITEMNVEDNTAAPAHLVLLNIVLTVGLLYYIWKHYREVPKSPSIY